MRVGFPWYGSRDCGWTSQDLVNLGVLCGLMLLFSITHALAQNPPAGTVKNVIGTLVVVRPDGIEERVQGMMALPLFEWDVVRTEPSTQALIDLTDGIQVAVNENSVFKVLGRWEKTKGITRIVRLRQGEIWVKTGVGPKPLEVETPVATAAVRETEFNIKVLEDGQTILTVIQGIVEFGTAFGTCPIRTATISYGVRGKRCTKPEPTDVKPTVAWTEGILK
jgi:ferric-dicitrate binding protein FerR (iron transport regulator)